MRLNPERADAFHTPPFGELSYGAVEAMAPWTSRTALSLCFDVTPTATPVCGLQRLVGIPSATTSAMRFCELAL